jgi:hypothetical protein
MKKFVYILILLLVSCAKETDWQPEASTDDYIIIDGIITNEGTLHNVYLKYSRKNLDDDIVPISDAVVIVSNEDSTWQFSEDLAEPGKYTSERIITALTGKNYSLLVLIEGNIYSAQALMAPGKAFSELSYKKNEENNLYHIDFVASAFEEDDPAMWEIYLDWSAVPGYENTDPESCRKRLLFYTLTTLDVSQVFAPLVEDVSFPAGTRIDQRRYSLTSEHAEFIRSLLLETNWQGGVFPTDPANIQSNISEGGLGYFAVCAVNKLSLIVEP